METGGNYTSVQKIIAQLPFKAIVTTNYDPGLWNALLEYRRDACANSPATWSDKDVVRRWRSRDIFEDQICPILHIHGSWEHPNTIILDNDRYREVYIEEYFNNMFRNLWQQESLIIIGCGFADNWLDRNLELAREI